MKKILNCAAAVIAAAAILGVQSCTSDPAAPENPGSNETPETPGTEASATIEVSDIDLWSNTAKVSVSAENIDDLKVYYGVKDSGVSHEIEAEEGVYTISAGYTASKNDAGLDIYSLVEGTGVFADKTYVVEVFDGAPSETNLPVASKELKGGTKSLTGTCPAGPQREKRLFRTLMPKARVSGTAATMTWRLHSSHIFARRTLTRKE